MRTAKIDIKTNQAVRAFIAEIDKHYERVGTILFGSRARHTHRSDSDADLAVLLKGRATGKFIAVKLSMDDIAYEVLLETGIRIQPLPIWEEEWTHPESYSNPRLLENINREGIPL